MSTLSKILQTKSRMSIFQRLKKIGYFSSFSHAGKYYTLTNIPQFDEAGDAVLMFGTWRVFHWLKSKSTFAFTTEVEGELMRESKAGIAVTMVVAIAASNTFVLPTHQVNALIMRPGGYKTLDYARAKAGMTILFLIVLIGMLYLFY